MREHVRAARAAVDEEGRAIAERAALWQAEFEEASEESTRTVEAAAANQAKLIAQIAATTSSTQTRVLEQVAASTSAAQTRAIEAAAAAARSEFERLVEERVAMLERLLARIDPNAAALAAGKRFQEH